jgi:hypothetical protein
MDPKNDPKKPNEPKPGGRPATKFLERHAQKTHPENRPDVDAQAADEGYEDAAFELPPPGEEAPPKKPDPNWQKGNFTKGYDKEKGRQ